MRIKRICDDCFIKIPFSLFCLIIMIGVFISKPDYLILIFAIVAVMLVALLDCSHREKQKNKNTADIIIFHLTVALCFLEIYICYEIFFQTGWDVWTIDIAARVLNWESEYLDWLSVYFGSYPNNMLLTYIYSICLKVNRYLGVLYPENGIMVFVALNCVVVSCEAFCLYRLVDKLAGKRIAIGSWFIFEVLLGLSPWNVIPYSDILASGIPCFILYLYYFCPIRWLAWGIMGVTGIAGYHLKPQSIIVLLALIFVLIYNELFKNIQQKSIRKSIRVLFDKKKLLTIVCLVIGCIFASLAYGAMEDSFNSRIFIDKNMKFPISHWFAMGLNEESKGMYSTEDVERDRSLETVEERVESDMQVALERIQKFGAAGLLKHVCRKFSLSMADGNFSWSTGLGTFYVTTYDSPNIAADYLRSFFWYTGENYSILSTIHQFLWVVVLLLNFFQILNRNSIDEELIMVTFVGIMLFEALFEATARHIISNLSIMIIGGVFGYKNICCLIASAK